MNKVILTAANGKSKQYKTKGNFNVPFNVLANSIKNSTYFFKKSDLEFMRNTLIPIGLTAKDAKIFVMGGYKSDIYSVPLDEKNKQNKALPYFHWDNAYQFMMDNATQEDVTEWLKRT